MEDILIPLVIIGGIIAAIVFAVLYVIAFILCILITISWCVMLVLDGVSGSGLFPNSPWIAWALCGAFIGAALGFWTIAPVYGFRKERRSLVVVAAFIPILLLAIFGAISRASAQPPVTSSAPPSDGLTSPIESRFNLTGQWKGTYASMEGAVMKLEAAEANHSEQKYRGTITGKSNGNPVTLRVEAVYDPENKTITIRETQVTYRGTWTLGTDEGRFEDGNRISGTGNDNKNPEYTWWFKRG